MSFYEDLGVPLTAAPEAIKAAHRKLASKHHPDKGGDKETFQRIQRAYDVLSDPERRKHYDATGADRKLDLEHLAMQSMAKLFSLVIEHEDEIHVDLVAKMREICDKEIELTPQRIAECTQRISKLERVVRRTKRRKGGENLLVQLAMAQIGMQRQMREAAARDLEVTKIVRRMLDDYHYEADTYRSSFGDLLMAASAKGIGSGLG